jgi:hypothetical protein
LSDLVTQIIEVQLDLTAQPPGRRRSHSRKTSTLPVQTGPTGEAR